MESLDKKWNTLKEIFSDEELVSFVGSFYSSIEKKRRTNAEIQLKLWRRSIDEIIKSWETCFMWSCVDSSLAFLLSLKEKWVDMSKISLCCELVRIKDSWFSTIHFFVQDNSSNPARVIDFVKAWEVAIYDSEYKNPKDWKEVEHLQNFYLPADDITWSDSLLTIATRMKLPISEEYFAWYIKKMQIDNTDETYERFLKYESWLRISLNKELALVKSVEEQKQETASVLVDELNVDAEHKELYSVMNEIWWIIWNLFWYPYWVVVWMERALRSETDPTLEKKSKQDYLLWTHEDLIEKFWVNDAIEVTYIKLKSWAEIQLTNTVRWQNGTWNSLESIMNYVNRTLQYRDAEKYKRFYELWFELQKFWKSSKSSKSSLEMVEDLTKKTSDIGYDEDWKFHYTHEGD